MSDTSQGPGWWQASDDKWYPPEETRPAPPARAGRITSQGSAVGVGCQNCGAHGSRKTVSNNITTKKRVKFGVFWVLFTILTGGIGLLIWLVWPRSSEVVGVDRYNECSSCGVRQ